MTSGSTADFIRLHSAALRALNNVRHSPLAGREEGMEEARRALDGFLELWNRSDTHPVPPEAGEAVRDARAALGEGDAAEAWETLLEVGRSLDEFLRP